MDDFSEFYAARKDTVFRTVAVALGDRAAAEDAVSEAFTRGDGWWIYFVPDATTGVDLAEVTKVTAYSPTGNNTLAVPHG